MQIPSYLEKHPDNRPLEVELLNFNGTRWTVNDALHGTLVTAAIGGGKSSAIGKTVIDAFLDAGMGGLVTTAKIEDTAFWKKRTRERGREKDLIIFNAASGHRFDPFNYLLNRPGRASGDQESIIALLSAALAIGQQETGSNPERYWDLQAEKLNRHSTKAHILAQRPFSLFTANKLIESLPQRPGQHEQPEYQQGAYLTEVLSSIGKRLDSLNDGQNGDLRHLLEFLTEKWPAMDDRPRTAIESTWSGMCDRFMFDPFRTLFCSGDCTIIPELCTHERKIILLDFPLLEYAETGKFIQILLKMVWQLAWLSRDLVECPNPVFMVQDEYMYFQAPKDRDNFFQQSCRGAARCANLYLCQNLTQLASGWGEREIGPKTKNFCGNIGTHIIGQNNDVDTLRFYSNLAGKVWRSVDNHSASATHVSVGGNQQLVDILRPEKITRLRTPDTRNKIAETYVYSKGRIFECTKTAERPEGDQFLLFPFSR